MFVIIRSWWNWRWLLLSVITIRTFHHDFIVTHTKIQMCLQFPPLFFLQVLDMKLRMAIVQMTIASAIQTMRMRMRRMTIFLIHHVGNEFHTFKFYCLNYLIHFLMFMCWIYSQQWTDIRMNLIRMINQINHPWRWWLPRHHLVLMKIVAVTSMETFFHYLLMMTQDLKMLSMMICFTNGLLIRHENYPHQDQILLRNWIIYLVPLHLRIVSSRNTWIWYNKFYCTFYPHSFFCSNLILYFFLFCGYKKCISHFFPVAT